MRKSGMWLWGACAAGLLAAPAARAGKPAWRVRKWDKIIRRECERYMPSGWDWLIFKALVKQESRFNPNAVSPAGAAGLTQLMPATARDLGLSPDDRFVPELAINAGVRYLRRMWNVWRAEDDGEAAGWQRTKFACGSYNAGLGNILRGQRRAEANNWPTDQWEYIDRALREVHAGWRETTTYVRRIFAYYEEFKARRLPSVFRVNKPIGFRERPHWIAARAVGRVRPAAGTPRPAAASAEAAPGADAAPRAARRAARAWWSRAAAAMLAAALIGLAATALRRGKGAS